MRKEKRYSLYECLDCGIWFSPFSDSLEVDNSTYINILNPDSQLRISECMTLEAITRSQPAKVLEIGAGFGVLARTVQAGCFEVEYSILEDCQPLQETLKSYGFKVYPKPSELPENYFDILVAHHVLEHFSDPRQFFGILNQCGKSVHRVCLAFPNRDNFLTRRGFYPDLNLPDHRFYYSLNEVEQIAAQYGYCVKEKRTIQKGRLLLDLRSAHYNRFRDNLDLFKSTIGELEAELAKLDGNRNLIHKIESDIEALCLGTEAYLVLERNCMM